MIYMVNENIIILLAIIIIIIAIYYIIITYTKHKSIIEKFSESKPLHGNVKFRNCQIYFTKDNEKCDTNYEQDDSDTCKYRFEGWKEIDTVTDKNNGDIRVQYAQKIYVDGKLNSQDFTNIKEETRCFTPLRKGDDMNIDNKMTIDGTLYQYRDFNFDSFNGITENICNVEYALKEELKLPNQFYKFVLDINNNIQDVKKGYFNDKQTIFINDDKFTINDFVKEYGNGVEYIGKNKFNIFKVSKFPNIDVKICKLIYNYLCYQSQVMNFSIVETKINLGKFINVSEASKIVTSKDINTDIKDFDWSRFKNTNSKSKENKLDDIIEALKNKENELISIDDERTKKLNGELATIAKNINDEAIKTEFKIMNFYNKYNSENHKLWNKEEFLKQFKVYNYKKHYLTAKETISKPNPNNANNIKTYIKNNFKKGFKYFKVDGYFGLIHSWGEAPYAGSNEHNLLARIDHIRNKEDIKELHQDSLSEGITDFRNISTLTKCRQIINDDVRYTMWFQGYFYAHEDGNYRFGAISDDASYIFINDELVVSNGPRHGMKDRNGTKEFKKGDLCKIDIYFGEYYGDDNLVIYWELLNRNSNRIYGAMWDNKTWIFHNKPEYKTNSENGLPYIELNGEKYIECNELGFGSQKVKDSSGNSGDLYYEFKKTNLMYDVVVQNDMEIRLLVIGGGGGGGMDMGGGGGAGGFIDESNISVSKGDIISISVGKGGNGAPEGETNQQGKKHNFKIGANNGKNTMVKIMDKYKKVKNDFIAYGGGYGGSSHQENIGDSSMGINGGDGGSGGGSGGYNHIANGRGKAGKAIYGNMKNSGNDGKNRVATYSAGGGGGAGYKSNNENGGDGKTSDITGESIYFAGGGGGAGYNSTGGNGGRGGGGGGAVGSTKGGIGYNNGNPGGGGVPKAHSNTPGGRAGDNTGGGGGGGSHYNLHNSGGSGGSGIVIMRIVNSPRNILMKYNYYSEQNIDYTKPNALSKVDVEGSKMNVVDTKINPKSRFYTSYVYLKKGYYYFNLNVNSDSSKSTNGCQLYTNSKITLYKSDSDHIAKYPNNREYITVYKDNMRTNKWIYIDTTNYYIINIYINYLSNKICDIPFNVSCVYRMSNPTNGNNVFTFSKNELHDNNYIKIPDSELKYYIDVSNYIFMHNDYVSELINAGAEYNILFNKFLEYYFTLPNSFANVITFFKTVGESNNDLHNSIEIRKINKLLEYLMKLKSDLSSYLNDKVTNNKKPINNVQVEKIFSESSVSSQNLYDIVTYEQYNEELKEKLKGSESRFIRNKHADRSVYVKVF